MTFARTSIRIGIVVAALAIPLHAQFNSALPSSTSTPTGTYEAAAYQYDDGTAENALGLTAGGEIAWLHKFTVIGGFTVINSISTSVGSPGGSSPPAGQPLTVYVWDDPNNDGNPADAVLLGSGAGIVVAPGTDTFTTIALSTPVPVTGTFFIGAMTAHVPGTFPAPMDEGSASLGRAWIVGDTATFDPNDLTNNAIPPTDMDSIGFPAVFLLRGNSDPWADLANGLAGTGGLTPQLDGTGTLVQGTPMSIDLSNAKANAAAILIVGINTLYAPAKSGIMVPDPLLIISTPGTDGSGNLSLGGTWPLGAESGRTTYFQYWIVDSGGPSGFAASNGLGGTTP